MKKLYIFFLSVLLLASCSSSRNGKIYQNIESDKVEFGVIENDLFTLEVAYVAAMGHSFVFECTVENKSDYPINLDKDQFYMSFNNGQIANPIEIEKVVSTLKKDRKRLKKRRKTETILGIVGVGLLAVIGASEGFSPEETLLLSAEPIYYIFDDRRWYKQGMDSIEDEIEYVRSSQFDHEQLSGGEAITRDLLFPTTQITSEVEIIFSHHGQEYSVIFPKKIFG